MEHKKLDKPHDTINLGEVRRLKSVVQAEIADIIHDYYKQTGIWISRIELDYVEHPTMGNPRLKTLQQVIVEAEI